MVLKNKVNKAFVPVIFPNGFWQNYNLPIMLKTKINKIQRIIKGLKLLLRINFDNLLKAYESPNPRDHFYMSVFGKTYAEKMEEQENEPDIDEKKSK